MCVSVRECVRMCVRARVSVCVCLRVPGRVEAHSLIRASAERQHCSFSRTNQSLDLYMQSQAAREHKPGASRLLLLLPLPPPPPLLRDSGTAPPPPSSPLALRSLALLQCSLFSAPPFCPLTDVAADQWERRHGQSVRNESAVTRAGRGAEGWRLHRGRWPSSPEHFRWSSGADAEGSGLLGMRRGPPPSRSTISH